MTPARATLWASALCALNLLDAGATAWGTSRGAVEVNPLMAALLSAGLGWFLLAKVAACGGVGVVAFGAAGARGTAAPATRAMCAGGLRLLTGIYALVAAWHAWLVVGYGLL